MSQQVFLSDCRECGRCAQVNASNLCEDCTDKLEARAHFVNELAEIRQRKIATGESETEGYTWRQMRQPSGKIVKHEE